MKIYVIRHGLTGNNKKEILNGRFDEPLAPEGVEQAMLAAQKMPVTIRKIYSSSLSRARQTAELLNFGRGLPISFHDEIMEVHFGSFTGKSWASAQNGEEFRRKYRDVKYDFRPEGESVDDVKARILPFIQMVHESHEDGEVLLVTHGGIVRLLQALERGTPAERVENASFHAFDTDLIIKNGLR